MSTVLTHALGSVLLVATLLACSHVQPLAPQNSVTQTVSQTRTAHLAHFTPPSAYAIKLPFKLDAVIAGQCQKHAIKQLTGMQNLSNAQIKTISGATQVRRAADNEAVEDDFHANRVTVFLKPDTQHISSAFCG